MLLNLTQFFVSGYKPVRFWKYPAYTIQRILSIPLGYGNDREEYLMFDTFRKALVDWFHATGIKAYVDNKTVFELRHTHKANTGSPNIFIGFYDLEFTLGLGVTATDEPYEHGSYSPKAL